MELASKILKGDLLAAAKLIRDIEDEAPKAAKELATLYPHTGKAHIVGITGAPGVGKSTLVDGLINILREKGLTIGVIAIDPTSPFTGGAILGDRIRMQRHSLDEGVFIRSLATRGWVGGLAKATMSTIHVMDTMGKDTILVETVGTGQEEIDITRVSDTSVAVLTPGLGDAIQMMKAGILEAADIFVINKADKDGVSSLKVGLEQMLLMKDYLPNEWKPDIILTEAIHNKGTEALTEGILRHKEFLVHSGELEKRRRQRARLELMETIEDFAKNYIIEMVNRDGYLEKVVDDLVQKRTSPHSAASKIVNEFTNQLRKGSQDK